MPAVKGERFEDDSSDRAEGDDELIDRAIDVVVELGQASTSSLQRKLKLGYARAARIMDELEEMGVIGPHEGQSPGRCSSVPSRRQSGGCADRNQTRRSSMPDTGMMPMTREELNARGIDVPDFVYVIGDAYVDHPSFGAAIISRVLEAKGFSVAIVSQPDWRSDRDFTRFGRPRLGFLVTSGNIDSMVAHYTAAKRKRSEDAYSPGGKAGKRPDRAVLVYCQKIRQLYGDIPLIIGGLEASLRRFAHYDYWDDRVRPSILEESGADLLLFGMGEHSILEVAQGLRDGIPVGELTEIRGSCYMTAPEHTPFGAAECPSYAQVCESKKAYAKACRIQYDQQDEVYGKRVIQRHGSRMLVQNPPALSLTTEELDWVYSLPYTRTYHPAMNPGRGAGDCRGAVFHHPQPGLLRFLQLLLHCLASGQADHCPQRGIRDPGGGADRADAQFQGLYP